ncbi:MAG: hypothetical protein CMP85_02135 [Gammaproteobacteria bacterium]|nr:hypothetical protein [Gammaproteobacteria bacterium]
MSANLFKASLAGDMARVQELLSDAKQKRNINNLYVSYFDKYNTYVGRSEPLLFSQGHEAYPKGKATALGAALMNNHNSIAALLIEHGATDAPAEFAGRDHPQYVDSGRSHWDTADAARKYYWQPDQYVYGRNDHRNFYWQPDNMYYVYTSSRVHPLCLAVRMGNTEGARLLLDSFAISDEHVLNAALFHAVVRCPPEIGKLLLERGANPNATYDSLTPLLHLCREFVHVRLFLAKELTLCANGGIPRIINWIRLLVSNGANVNGTDPAGRSALYYVVYFERAWRLRLKRINSGQLSSKAKVQSCIYIEPSGNIVPNLGLTAISFFDALVDKYTIVDELLKHELNIPSDVIWTRDYASGQHPNHWRAFVQRKRREQRERREIARHHGRLAVNRVFRRMGLGPGVARHIGDKVTTSLPLFRQFTRLNIYNHR